jgi:outer membrane protein TolC
MKIKLLLLTIFISSSLSTFAQEIAQNLTFEDAFNEMSEKNLTLKGAEAEKKSNEFLRKTTRGLYLPKISLNANYTKFNDDIGLDISGLTDAAGAVGITPSSNLLSPSKFVIQKEQVGIASLDVIWPIFTGGKIMAANKAMDAKIDEAQYKIEETKSKLNTELVERYYGYRLATKAVILYQETLDVMLLHQRDAQKLEENGMISKAQKLYADLSVSTAQSELNHAKNTQNTVEQALKNTIANEGSINVTSELFLNKEIEPVEFFINSAMENNPLLKQVESKKKMAEQMHKISSSDYLPTVAIIGNKILTEYQLTDAMPNWFVGVNLRWTIFDGMARVNHAKSSKATVDRVEFLETKAHEDITTLINKLYNNTQTCVDQLEDLNSTYKFALEYERVTKKSFSEGFSTTKDVVDAELMLNKVKVGRLKIMNDYVLALAKLVQYAGKPEMFLEYSHRDDRERETFGLEEKEN